MEEKVNQRHREAMDLAEMAFFARQRMELSNFWKFTFKALNLEKAAARELKDQTEVEPTRSVLYLGAARLALQLDRFDEAIQLLDEACKGNPFEEIRKEMEETLKSVERRRQIRQRVQNNAQGFLEDVPEDKLGREKIQLAMNASVKGAEAFFGKETLDMLLNRIALQVDLESKNLVTNAAYQIFESAQVADTSYWLEQKKPTMPWVFWESYKKYLDNKGYAHSSIRQLDKLTDDILNRVGDPNQRGVWNRRGMVVGDVQSGKTGNFIGLINKAADAGFRLVIVLTGLYENLRRQTQLRLDEGFAGRPSEAIENVIGVGKYRPESRPVHAITTTSDDLRKKNLRNYPLDTNDWYVLAIKKNVNVLKALLTWLHARAEKDGDSGFKIIRNIPLLIIDDEADYASINVDRDFVSRTNGCIRAMLSLFEQSAFIGYTATPYANVFISDRNETASKSILIDGKNFRLGEDLFPSDFIINLPPPSNYIGYNKVFGTELSESDEELDESLPMIRVVDDFEDKIPQGHKKEEELPDDLPGTLKHAIRNFVLVIATRHARGQEKEHNSMLLHVSWYVRWINHIAVLVDNYVKELSNGIRYQQEARDRLHQQWKEEFEGKSALVTQSIGYEDELTMEHEWAEIEPHLKDAVRKIQVRAVHGPRRDFEFQSTDLDYHDYSDTGLSVIAVGGNKLSRGLTLEGLSISYFLRATRFYDTLMQMGRWFGYRRGYADLCRLYTTKSLVNWYQFIGTATEELKEEFDIMGLAERTPENYGLKVRRDQGALLISAANKTRGGTKMELSLSGHLLETYTLRKKRNVLKQNLQELNLLLERLGPPSGVTRQNQSFVWQDVTYKEIDTFIAGYKTAQRNIHPNHLRGYIGRQLQHQHLIKWTVVLISNSDDRTPHEMTVNGVLLNIGQTLRSEDEKRSDSETYALKKAHIISPPHEYLDMDETDARYKKALDETIKASKANKAPSKPLGKYIRKHRGADEALLLIYLLDPAGFGGQPGLPATGYAISLPEIQNDDPWPYMVNDRFVEELFGDDDPFEVPEDAVEHPEKELEEV